MSPWARRLAFQVSPPLPPHTPAAHLLPGPYQTAAQANPRGITWRPHHNLISLISLIGLMQAPRQRRLHTAVAIKQAQHYPTANLPPRANPNSAPQTHGVYRGLPRRSPSGRRRAPPSCQTGQTGQTGQTQAPRHRNTHTAVAIKNLKRLRRFLKSIQRRRGHLLLKRELCRRCGIFRQNRAKGFRVRSWR